MLESGSDLHVNERQKTRHYRARPTEEEESQMAFFSSRGARVNCTIMAMLYTHSIGNQLYNTMVVFKMCDRYLAQDIPAFVMYCIVENLAHPSL